MKQEMARPITWREGYTRRIVWPQRAGVWIELPDEDAVEAKIGVENVAALGVRQDHMGVCAIVSAEGETAGWSIRGFPRPDGARVYFDVHGWPEASILKDRQDGHRATKVVGYECE